MTDFVNEMIMAYTDKAELKTEGNYILVEKCSERGWIAYDGNDVDSEVLTAKDLGVEPEHYNNSGEYDPDRTRYQITHFASPTSCYDPNFYEDEVEVLMAVDGLEKQDEKPIGANCRFTEIITFTGTWEERKEIKTEYYC